MTVDLKGDITDKLTDKEKIIYDYSIDKFKSHQSYAYYIDLGHNDLAESMAHSYGMQKVKTYRHWCRKSDHGGDYYPEWHHFRAEYDRIISEWYIKNGRQRSKE